MTLAELVRRLDLTILTSLPEGDVEVTRGYVSDLLSDVLGKASEGAIWVTLQSHPNVIAVASLLNLSAVIIVGGIIPDDATLERAREASVPVLSTQLPAFEIVGRLYQLGIRGNVDSCVDG